MRQVLILLAFIAATIGGMVLGCKAMHNQDVVMIILSGWVMVTAFGIGLKSGILRRLVEKIYHLD